MFEKGRLAFLSKYAVAGRHYDKDAELDKLVDSRIKDASEGAPPYDTTLDSDHERYGKYPEHSIDKILNYTGPCKDDLKTNFLMSDHATPEHAKKYIDMATTNGWHDDMGVYAAIAKHHASLPLDSHIKAANNGRSSYHKLAEVTPHRELLDRIIAGSPKGHPVFDTIARNRNLTQEHIRHVLAKGDTRSIEELTKNPRFKEMNHEQN